MGKRKRLQLSPETSRIDLLPDDVLIHILSFLPTMVQIARTSILSRRWRNLWHSTTCLNFDATTVMPTDRLRDSQVWYVEWVNKVIDARMSRPGLPLVKDLRIRYELNVTQGCHIDRWINFAIANGVETFHLDVRGYLGIMYAGNQHILSLKTWRTALSRLSNVISLKALVLSCVRVSKKFIQFILSSCPLLEDLSLDYAGTYSDLDVSGTPPLRLKRLKIEALRESALAKLCAPYLTSFYYRSAKFNPEKIDVPMLTDLSIGGLYGPLRIMDYLGHFWSYLPQLEKLHLTVERCHKFRLQKLPKLVKLKYLKLRFQCDTDPIFHQILKFISACPVLGTFAIEQVRGCECSIQQHLSSVQMQNAERVCRFKCLEQIEVYGADNTIDQKVLKCIIRKAPNLKNLIIDTHLPGEYPFFVPTSPETIKDLEAKAKKLCRMSTLEVNITVAG